MTREPDNDDFEATLRRMEQEFGTRRPAEEEVGPAGGQRLFGEARPIPQQQQPVPMSMPMSRSRAAYVLIGINGLVYGLTALLSILLSGDFLRLFTPLAGVLALGWKENELIFAGQWWRLISAMFLHGNLVHIFFNLYALYALGPETERIYGTGRFLATYFLAGLAGSIASYAFSAYPSVGASGAVFGLFGALGVFFYLTRHVTGEMGRRQLQSMAFVIIINLFIGFSVSGIDNFAHLGGLAGGALAGYLLAPRLDIDQRLYPPVIVRSFLAQGWAGAAALLLGLITALFVIRPPLLP